jgi:hypothetical protein
VGQLPIGTGTATIPTTIAYYDTVFGHNVPKAFADYMQLQGQIWDSSQSKFVQGKIYTDNPTANVFGYPISEPYWAQASVAGKTQSVMVQLFERRILTYTPANPDGFKVEMGNIGQHYYHWRYGFYPLQWSYTKQNDMNIQRLNGLALDAQSNVYVSSDDSILKFDTGGKLLSAWNNPGNADGQFKAPTSQP